MRTTRVYLFRLFFSIVGRFWVSNPSLAPNLSLSGPMDSTGHLVVVYLATSGHARQGLDDKTLAVLIKCCCSGDSDVDVNASGVVLAPFPGGPGFLQRSRYSPSASCEISAFTRVYMKADLRSNSVLSLTSAWRSRSESIVSG